MKRLLIRFQFDPEDIFTVEEQDQTLEALEYTTEYFPEMEFEDDN